MRLIFHGILRDLCGADVTMKSDTVADAIEGYSRQQPKWPWDVVIDVVGFDTPDKLKESADEVHLIPAMVGGGGKFGTIILGVAMVGLAFATGGASLVAGHLALAAGTLGTLSGSLLVGGALMVLQGTMNLFMKSPKLNTNSAADPAASRYLPVNKNTTAIGTPITLAWGRIDLAGQWLSLQSDSSNLSYGTFPANPT